LYAIYEVIVVALLFFSAGLLKAQAPKILYTEPEKEDSRRTNFEIIGKLKRQRSYL